MIKIINECGCASDNASIVGAIVGCFMGFNILPKEYLGRLIHKEWLDMRIINFIKA